MRKSRSGRGKKGFFFTPALVQREWGEKSTRGEGVEVFGGRGVVWCSHQYSNPEYSSEQVVYSGKVLRKNHGVQVYLRLPIIGA